MFSQHQKHGAFILIAVVVILLVVKQKLFIVTWRRSLNVNVFDRYRTSFGFTMFCLPLRHFDILKSA